MEEQLTTQAIAAATAVARDLGLEVAEALVLHSSNKLSLRLLPCAVFVRVAPSGQQVPALEVALVEQLVRGAGPVAVLEPRVAPRVYERDDLAMTFWTFYEPGTVERSPAEHADVLRRVHAAMRSVELATPHATDRVAEAERLVADRERTPALGEDDRALLLQVLREGDRMVSESGRDQVLHGEPHPGNVINTADGLLVVDLETVCRGPVKLDVAHVPEDVAEHYPGLDPDLLRTCRRLVAAMVAAWRWDVRDELPDGERLKSELMSSLRSDPGTSGDAAAGRTSPTRVGRRPDAGHDPGRDQRGSG